MLRISAWLLSFLIHAALSLVFIECDTATRESGSGTDDFVVEQGIAIEGFAQVGEATPLSEARPEIDEVKAEEPVEEKPPEVETAEIPKDTEVVTSEEGPEQEALRPKEPEREIEEPRPREVATIDQAEELVVEAGPEKRGGDANAISEYRGRLHALLRRRAVRPAARAKGTVEVSFTLAASGVVVSRGIKKSSGVKAIDEAALATIDRIEFPSLPPEMGVQSYSTSVPFTYR